jgi:hypothetical protein
MVTWMPLLFASIYNRRPRELNSGALEQEAVTSDFEVGCRMNPASNPMKSSLSERLAYPEWASFHAYTNLSNQSRQLVILILLGGTSNRKLELTF